MTGTETSEEIEKKLTSQNIEVIDIGLVFAKDLLSTEQERSETIAKRATNLLGFAGVIAALTVDVVGLIWNVRVKSQALSVLLGGLYVAALISILGIIWWASGARRPEIRAVPHIDGIIDFQGLPPIEAKRKWLSDLISAYRRNTVELNRRVTDVYCAQECLVLAVILLLALAILSVLVMVLT